MVLYPHVRNRIAVFMHFVSSGVMRLSIQDDLCQARRGHRASIKRVSHDEASGKIDEPIISA